MTIFYLCQSCGFETSDVEDLAFFNREQVLDSPDRAHCPECRVGGQHLRIIKRGE